MFQSEQMYNKIVHQKKTDVLFLQCVTGSIHVEHFRQRNRDGRIIRVDFHNISHIVPPFLDNRIGAHILRRFFPFCLLASKQNIRIFIPIDRIIINTTVRKHFFQLRPNCRMSFLILLLETRFQEHLKSFTFHKIPPFQYRIIIIFPHRLHGK